MKDEYSRKTVESDVKATDEYPGATIDSADKEKVDPALVRERTCTLNNNPRNDK